MRVIKATIPMLETRTLVLGFQGENLRTQLRIDCASTFAEYPNATPALAIKPPTGETYPVFVERDGNEVVWDIVANNLALKGDGELQLTFYKDNVIAKTSIGHITVNRSLQIDGEMPDVVATWIENANRKLAEVDAQIVELEGMVDTAIDAATRAEQSASTVSTKAEQAAGSAATATEKATEATNAATTATAKAAEAALSATQARNSAMSAANSESGATAKAVEATTAATTATTKAEQATEAAQTATEKAGDASASATAAHASATDAASSATAASASETAAKASETAASTSASQAAQSVLDAGANAQTAMQKAAEATQSATNAAASATNAATSAETASTKAGEAAQSAQAVAETAEQLAESLEQIGQNTADIAEHEQEYNALKDATLIHNTASGAIASFVDGAEMPVDKLTVQIEPVQEGTGDPSPDNVRPITGWTGAKVMRTGKNLLDDSIKAVFGSRLLIGATSIYDNPTYLKAGTYSITAFGANQTFAYLMKSQNALKTIVNGINHGSFTVDNDGYYRIDFYGNDAISGNVTGVILVPGSTYATAYEPYAGQTYDITFPSEAGTVYGGTLDVTNGVLTVDRAMVDLESLVWSYDTTYAFFASISIPTRKIGVLNIWSDLFKTNAGSWSGTPVQNALWGNGSNATIYVQIPPYDNVADFVQLVSGHQLVYELATPITYNLTPQEITTLLGENNLWHDANGDISVGYKANTKLYIDGKIAELVARIVNS